MKPTQPLTHLSSDEEVRFLRMGEAACAGYLLVYESESFGYPASETEGCADNLAHQISIQCTNAEESHPEFPDTGDKRMATIYGSQEEAQEVANKINEENGVAGYYARVLRLWATPVDESPFPKTFEEMCRENHPEESKS